MGHRVGIDLRGALDGQVSGVEVYIDELLPRLLTRLCDSGNEVVLFTSGSFDGAERFLSMAKQRDGVEYVHVRRPNRILNASMRVLGWPKLDRLMGGVDVILFPNLRLAPVSKGVERVLVVHDLSFQLYPEFFSWKQRVWHRVMGSPRNFDDVRLLAVSHHTAWHVHHAWSRRPELALSGDGSNTVTTGSLPQELLEFDGRYFLLLGSIEPRKNIVGVLDAYRSLPEAVRLQHPLVVVGDKEWLSGSLNRRVAEWGLKNSVIRVGRLSMGDRNSVVRSAMCLLYPSFFEGFGFPVRESLALGTRVITSTTSSLPEVSGVNSLQVDPYHTEQLTEAMKVVINEGDEEVRDELSFSWEQTADTISEELNSLA